MNILNIFIAGALISAVSVNIKAQQAPISEYKPEGISIDKVNALDALNFWNKSWYLKLDLNIVFVSSSLKSNLFKSNIANRINNPL